MGDTVETVFTAAADVASTIATGVRERAAATATENRSGETQREADVWADTQFQNAFTDISGVCGYASEEQDTVVACGSGAYTVAVDPLDGSSNIPSNNLCGTIIGLYNEPLPAAGEHLVAAAYILYGPSTTMVTATQGSVNEYRIEDGKPVLLTEPSTLPEPTVYGFGGTDPAWTPRFQSFAEQVRTRLKCRYGGAFVGDVNQVLHHGGVFSYPALTNKPEGKLRTVFEAAPIAYIFETLENGASTDGETSVLQVEPASLHGRTPVHVGNTSLVNQLHEQQNQ